MNLRMRLNCFLVFLVYMIAAVFAGMAAAVLDSGCTPEVDNGYITYLGHDAAWSKDKIQVPVYAELLTDLEMESTLSAIDRINATVGIPVCFFSNSDLQPDRNGLIHGAIRVTSGDDDVMREPKTLGMTSIVYEPTDLTIAAVKISYRTGLSEGFIKAVAIHEFGHAFGLADDSGIPGSVMNGEIDGRDTEFTVADAAYLREVYRGDIKVASTPTPQPL